MGGSFDPAHISRRALAQKRDEEPVYAQLNKLLSPGELRSFVDSHPHFSWVSREPKGMLITWSSEALERHAHQPKVPVTRGRQALPAKDKVS